MNQQKTVESRVLSILKDCPRARFDDMILIMHYYNRYANFLRAGEQPLCDLAFNYKVYGRPCFETIRRARQRVQSLFSEYSRNTETDDDSVCGNVTIYGGKVSNTACLFVLDMILLVYVLKCLKKGDIFAERQQRDEAENTDRMRPSLFGAGV